MQYFAKAIYAGVVAFIGSTTAALVQIGDGASFGEVETVAWLVILGATIVAAGGVYGLQAAPASVSTSTR
jgi:hypothetical protein